MSGRPSRVAAIAKPERKTARNPASRGEPRGERVVDAGEHQGLTGGEQVGDRRWHDVGLARCCAVRAGHDTERHVPRARIQMPHHYRTLDPGDPARARRPRGRRRLPALGRALPAGARRARRRRRWRCTRGRTSRATTSRRGLVAGGYAFFGAHTRYLNNDADALHERVLARRRRHDRVAARARLPAGGAARQLGRRLAVRLLPRAGGEGRRRSGSQRAPSGDARAAARDRHAGGRRVRPAGRAPRRGPLPARPARPVDRRRDRIPSRPIRDSTCTIRATAIGRCTTGRRATRRSSSPSSAPPSARAASASIAQALEWCEEARWYRRRLGTAGDAPPAERTHARAARDPAPLPAHLPDARRPALSRPATRPVAAPARIDLLVRARSGRRQLRRGPRAHDERARLAVDVVRACARTPPSSARCRGSRSRRSSSARSPTLDIYPSECRRASSACGAADKQWASSRGPATTSTRSVPRARSSRIRRIGWRTRSSCRGCASAGPPSRRHRAGLTRATTRRRRRRHRPVRVRQAARHERGRGGRGRDPRRARRRRPRPRRRRRALPVRHRVDHRRGRRGGAGVAERALLLDAQPRWRRLLRGRPARRGGAVGGPRVRRAHVPRPQSRAALVLREGIHGGRAAVGEDRAAHRGILPVAGAVRRRVAGAGDGAHRAPAHARSRHHRGPPGRGGVRRAQPRGAQPLRADARAALAGRPSRVAPRRRAAARARLLSRDRRRLRARPHHRRARARSPPAAGVTCSPASSASGPAHHHPHDWFAFDRRRWVAAAAERLWGDGGRRPRRRRRRDALRPLHADGPRRPRGLGVLRARGGRPVRRRRRDPLARRAPAGEHARRPALRGVHPRVQQSHRGRAPGARDVDLPGDGRRGGLRRRGVERSRTARCCSPGER